MNPEVKPSYSRALVGSMTHMKENCKKWTKTWLSIHNNTLFFCLVLKYMCYRCYSVCYVSETWLHCGLLVFTFVHLIVQHFDRILNSDCSIVCGPMEYIILIGQLWGGPMEYSIVIGQLWAVLWNTWFLLVNCGRSYGILDCDWSTYHAILSDKKKIRIR